MCDYIKIIITNCKMIFADDKMLANNYETITTIKIKYNL